MKRIKLTYGSARVSKKINQKTIDALNQMTEQVYKMTGKPLGLYGVRWRFSGDDKFMYELKAITNLSTDEILEELKPLKASNNAIKNYYLATGKFPCKITDKFLVEHGFEKWYDVFRSGLLNAT